MVIGQSKDLGTCKSVKKNGEKCTVFVNLSRCEFCVYHLKQEYKNCSRRSELQSNFAGRGLAALRNKVLGKNEVFYAGRSYTAIPTKSSKKLTLKDENRLKALSGSMFPMTSGAGISRHLRQTDLNSGRLKDAETLLKLGNSTTLTKTKDDGTLNTNISAEVTLDSSKKLSQDIISSLKEKAKIKQIPQPTAKSESSSETTNTLAFDIPILSGEFNNKSIDLSSPISKKLVNRAKLNAYKYVQRNGPIKRQDPNSVRSQSKKRSLEECNSSDKNKKQKIEENGFYSERFKKIMMLQSKHTDLLEDYDNEQAEKYFEKLEKKEKLEEKMAATHKIACKAVRCLQCKYISFSASELCKNEKHPLKVFDSVKRFYKCNDCKNRTVTLDMVPLKPCNKCGSGNWIKAGMINEKTVDTVHKLSIRGDEQTFLNSNISSTNLDLLVPENTS